MWLCAFEPGMPRTHQFQSLMLTMLCLCHARQYPFSNGNKRNKMEKKIKAKQGQTHTHTHTRDSIYIYIYIQGNPSCCLPFSCQLFGPGFEILDFSWSMMTSILMIKKLNYYEYGLLFVVIWIAYPDGFDCVCILIFVDLCKAVSNRYSRWPKKRWKSRRKNANSTLFAGALPLPFNLWMFFRGVTLKSR